jgi:hypothetical protein
MQGMNRVIFSLAALSLSLPALAQGAPKPAPAPPTVAQLREQIDDLGLLKSLIPLQLTSAQIEALLPPLRAASAAAVSLKKQSDEAVLGLESEITKAYAAALAGKPLPESLEKKTNEAAKATAERFVAARRKATDEIFAVAKEKLTEAQRKEIEKQCIAFYGGKRVPAQYKEKPDKAPREVVLDLALKGYIEQMFLLDRVLFLLEKMRVALDKP